MTRALVLAALAGVIAAAGVVELAATARSRRRRGMRAIRALSRRIGASRRAPPGGLGARVDAAGVGVGVGEVMAIKLGAVPVAALAALAVMPLAPGRLGFALLAASPSAGFLAPDFWLRVQARMRARVMEAEQADVLDLLRVAVGAGLGPWRALAEVGRRRSGPLATELRAAAARAALGVPRAEALAQLVRRCPLEGVAALASAIGRAERHGAPLAPALRALAADARAERAQRLRERAGRAAPKIQLVVALLLVPAVMLLVGACLAAALL
jgi:tight adherence protein C